MNVRQVNLLTSNARKTVGNEVGFILETRGADYGFISEDARWLADWAYRIINSAETTAMSVPDGEDELLKKLDEAVAKAVEASDRAKADIANAKAAQRQAAGLINEGRGT